MQTLASQSYIFGPTSHSHPLLYLVCRSPEPPRFLFLECKSLVSWMQRDGRRRKRERRKLLVTGVQKIEGEMKNNSSAHHFYMSLILITLFTDIFLGAISFQVFLGILGASAGFSLVCHPPGLEVIMISAHLYYFYFPIYFQISKHLQKPLLCSCLLFNLFLNLFFKLLKNIILIQF